MTSKRKYWNWERVYKLGRQSLDGGVRMVCERLAAKLAKNISLTEHDKQQLDRIDNASFIRYTTYC